MTGSDRVLEGQRDQLTCSVALRKKLIAGGNYRPDIDGLRAVSVLAVIAFHYSLIPVASGYIGVDVFFVISGFLITSLVVKDLEAGEFSSRSSTHVGFDGYYQLYPY